MGINLDTPREAVVDAHNTKKSYERWKATGKHLNASPHSAQLILEFIDDKEAGRNSDKYHKDSRSYIRLNTLRVRIPQLARWFKTEFNKEIDAITTDDVTTLINKLNKGHITRKNGKPYLSASDFVKDLKAFWHWHMRRNARKDILIKDVTEDVSDGGKRIAQFVYFKFEECQKMMAISNLKYRAIISFLFDSGVRAPSEFLNVRVKDLEWDENGKFYWLNVRQETSKTKGRRIKLLLCSDVLKSYLSMGKALRGMNQNTSPDAAGKVTTTVKPMAYRAFLPDDFLFDGHPSRLNKKIGEIAMAAIKKKPTLYDFRHCSICHFCKLYDNQTQLMYRVGHSNPKQLIAYHQFVGVSDELTREGLDTAEMKTKLQGELEQERKRVATLEESHAVLAAELAQVKELIEGLRRPAAHLVKIIKNKQQSRRAVSSTP